MSARLIQQASVNFMRALRHYASQRGIRLDGNDEEMVIELLNDAMRFCRFEEIDIQHCMQEAAKRFEADWRVLLRRSWRRVRPMKAPHHEQSSTHA